MNEQFPPMFGGFYLTYAPLLKWACFCFDALCIFSLFMVMHNNRKTINPWLRFFLIGIMLQVGSRAGAILLHADLYIHPFAFIGSLCLAGASVLSALGLTGLRPDIPKEIKVVLVKEGE